MLSNHIITLIQLLLFSSIHRISVLISIPKFHSSAVIQYTIVHLYIRAERCITERTHGRVLFHANKFNLAPPNVKCTFNNYTNSFELRHFTNSKIDWNNNPIYILNDTYNTWSTSYNTYKLNIKSLNSSISDSQSSHQSAQ